MQDTGFIDRTAPGRFILMPHITIYPTTSDVPSLIACQILSFIRITWFDIYQYDLDALFMPEEWHPVHVVLAERHAVLSYTAVVWRTIAHAGEPYKAYGLSSVFTYPAFRKRGYGRQVVDAATGYIARDPEADLALLFTDPGLSQFYERSGWEHTPDVTIMTGDPGNPQIYDAFTMMRFLSPKGKQARAKFEHEPVYFAEHGW
jgi:GNAT superfamily N-acetyltransferase